MSDMKNRTILLAFVFAAALQSCQVDDAEMKTVMVELGAKTKEYVLEASEGSFDIQVYANDSYHAEMSGESTWLTLVPVSGKGDGVISAGYQMNEGFKRMATVVLCSDIDERRDTLLIKQKGMMTAELSIDNASIICENTKGVTSVPIDTNIPFEDFDVNISYSDENAGEWIEEVSIDGGTLSLGVSANQYEEKVRTATILLSYTDGWGEKSSLLLNITQKTAKGVLGTLTSFEDVRLDYATGDPVDKYIIIEGIVVSNTENGNAGENEQKTTSSIDYNGSKTSVYLESVDGKYGFCLHTKAITDNVFKQYDKVQVLLYGATITRSEEPERYDITGITNSMVVSQVAGSASDVPVKTRTIGTLTDDDIYTYVTLQDVEFPIRKGGLSPINEGYSIGGRANRISKYPLLVRDKDGNHTYMYTNTVCLYRNDGTRLPYGSGSISGVIVHERFCRFEWKNGADPLDVNEDLSLGNIGRYQIRHQNKEDIWGGMNDSVEDSFSAILAEYRFWNPDVENGRLLPTYGENGWFTHTYQSRYSGSPAKDFTNEDAYNQHLYSEATFSYLGPMGLSGTMFGENTGNVNGLGIILDPEKDHYNPEMEDWVGSSSNGTEWLAPSTSDEVGGKRIANGGSMAGKSWCSPDCYCAFRSIYWWDYDTNRGYSWLINFSTEGISTDHISLQISAMNTSQRFYSPRYWKLEWGLTDQVNDDSKWNLVAEYTVPDISTWSNTLYSSIVGYKAMDFELPAAILGHENVYIKLTPASDICSTGADYADAVIGPDFDNDMHSSSLDYIAIRYNKQ